MATFLAGAIFAAPPSGGTTSATILSKSLLIISPYGMNRAFSLCSIRLLRKKKMLTLSLRVVEVSSSRIQLYRSSWRARCLRANIDSLRDADCEAERWRSWSKNCRRPSKGSSGILERKSCNCVSNRLRKNLVPRVFVVPHNAMKEGTPVKSKKSSSGGQPGLKEKKKIKSDHFKSSTISEVPEEPVNKRKRDSTKDDSRKSKKKQKKESKTKDGQEELEIDINAPNPLSKKGLRLQKKGKPVSNISQPRTNQSTPASIDTTHPDRNKLLKGKSEAEFSVWIGNLSYKSDVKALRGWLVRGDKRVTDKEMTRINLPLNANGRSKGLEKDLIGLILGLRMLIY